MMTKQVKTVKLLRLLFTSVHHCVLLLLLLLLLLQSVETLHTFVPVCDEAGSCFMEVEFSDDGQLHLLLS